MKIIENFVREGLSVERNFELLGIKIEGKPNIKQVMEAADKWWKKNVLGVIKEIATNPAASCLEAQDAVRYVLGKERQRALMGMDDGSGGEMILEIMGDVRQRCHEEALDECNLTGRYDHLLAMVVS